MFGGGFGSPMSYTPVRAVRLIESTAAQSIFPAFSETSPPPILTPGLELAPEPPEPHPDPVMALLRRTLKSPEQEQLPEWLVAPPPSPVPKPKPKPKKKIAENKKSVPTMATPELLPRIRRFGSTGPTPKRESALSLIN